MLIFFVVVQRIIFKSAFFTAFVNKQLLEGYDDPQDVYDMVVTARYSTIALEYLFIMIPFRHNFVIHNLELS